MEISSLRRKSNFWGWILSIPAAVGILIFTVYPVVYSLYLSFTDCGYVPVDLNFVGLDNYKWIFTDQSLFFESLGLSLTFTVLSTAIQTVLGFFMAYMLYSLKGKLQSFYRVILYLPNILPTAAAAVMWVNFFEPNYGMLDMLLQALGMDPVQNWISEGSDLQLFCVILVNTWKHVGLTMLIYFVAMNAINKEILESAQVDGANRLAVVTRIILPVTWYTTGINVLLSMIGGLKSYDLFMLLFDKTTVSMNVVGLYIFNTAFTDQNYGRATAMSILLAVIISILIVVVNKVMKEKDA